MDSDDQVARRHKRNYDALNEEVRRCERLADTAADLDLFVRNERKVKTAIHENDLDDDQRADLIARIGTAARRAERRLKAAAADKARDKQSEAADFEYMRLVGMFQRVERSLEQASDLHSGRLLLLRLSDTMKGATLKKKHVDELHERMAKAVESLRAVQRKEQRRKDDQADVAYMQAVGAVTRADHVARVSIDWDHAADELRRATATVAKAGLKPSDADTLSKRLKAAGDVLAQRRKASEERRNQRQAELHYSRLIGAVRRFEWLADSAKDWGAARAEFKRLTDGFKGVTLKKDDAEELRTRLQAALSRLNARAEAVKTSGHSRGEMEYRELTKAFDVWQQRARSVPDSEMQAVFAEIIAIQKRWRELQDILTSDQNRDIVVRIRHASALLAARQDADKLVGEDSTLSAVPVAKPAGGGGILPDLDDLALSGDKTRPKADIAPKPGAAKPTANDEAKAIIAGIARLEALVKMAADVEAGYEEIEQLHWSLQESRSLSGKHVDAFKKRIDAAAVALRKRREEAEAEQGRIAARNADELTSLLGRTLPALLQMKNFDQAFETLQKLRDKVFETNPLPANVRDKLSRMLDSSATGLNQRIDAHYDNIAKQQEAQRRKSEAPIRAKIIDAMEAVTRIDALVNDDDMQLGIKRAALGEWRPGTRQKDYRGDLRAEIEVLENRISARRAEQDKLNRAILALEAKLETPIMEWVDW